VRALCARVGMSRQNYYARHRQRKQRAIDEELVVQWVKQERKLQPRVGTRKLHMMLEGQRREAGIQLGRDRLFEVLRRHELLVRPKRRERPCTTNSRHYLPVFGNLIKEREVSAPHQVWVSDVTYLRTVQGFLYLALITDRWSRKVVGYHCGDTLEVEGTLKALEMALEQLPAGAKPIHHSDRGSQYCCHEYVGRLQARGLGISMTESDHCAENALAERVNGIFKGEYGLGQEFGTKELGRRATLQSIPLYNVRRPHRSLNYRTPETVHRLGL